MKSNNKIERNISFFDIISEYIIEIPIIQREYAQGRTTDKVKSIRKRFVDDLVASIKNNEKLHLGFVYGKIEGKENQVRKQMNKDAIFSILETVKFYAQNLEMDIDAEVRDLSISNGDNLTTLKFIPLDGQQRLTTLFLLHWYIYMKGGKVDNTKWFNNFKYSNRKSALAFCKELIKAENISLIREKLNSSSKSDIKDVIVSRVFCLKKWMKDPTVKGMLEMLKDIEKAFPVDYDFSKIDVERLPFQFDFMDLDQLKQTDELYVKMNSRGKQLSDYEHFKSWLQEIYQNVYELNGEDNNELKRYFSEKEINQVKNEKEWLESFWEKLDTVWLNYFWRNIDSDFSDLDNFYYNFIKNLALMHNLATNKSVPFDAFKELYGLIRNTEIYDSTNVTYIPLDKFKIPLNNENLKGYFLFNLETLKFIDKTFESLLYLKQGNNLADLKLDEIFTSPFINFKITSLFLKKDLFTPSLWHSVYFYAFFVFINDEKPKGATRQLKDWLRFTRNIIYNTYIQNPENYNNALKQINYLSSFKCNIAKSMIANEINNSFFDNKQFKEECIKFELINDETVPELQSDNTWESLINHVENHSYFYGQVGFLLNFAKDKHEIYSLEKFEFYSKEASSLFHADIRESKERLLERLLLSQGDENESYFPNYSSCQIFCNPTAGGLRTRNENWRIFFESNKVDILKKAIDNLVVFNNKKNDNYKDLIRKYIENYRDSNFSSNDKHHWKYLFLKYPDAINYCKESAIRMFKDNDVRLLKGYAITAYHVELRTYCFYLEHTRRDENGAICSFDYSPFIHFWYLEDLPTDGHPAFCLSGFNYCKKEYRLDVRYSRKNNHDNIPEFDLCFFHNTSIENRESDINLQGYVYDAEQYKHYTKTVPYNDILKELEKVTNYLKELVESELIIA